MLFIVLLLANVLAHRLADYILQTDTISKHKAEKSARGWGYNLLHGAHHFIACAAVELLTVLGLYGVDGVLNILTWGFLGGLLFIVGTHMFIDRRWPVRWLLEHTGSPKFADMVTPVCGMAVADQTLHHACLYIGSYIQATF